MMTTLKHLSFVLGFLICSTSSIAQEIEIEEVVEATPGSSTEFELEIDEELFKKRGAIYWEVDGVASVFLGVRNVSYEDMKNHIGKNDLGLIKIIEEKEIELEGIPFLYAKQEQKRGDRVVEILSFVKNNSENSILEIGIVYVKGKEENYRALIERAAITAKVKE